MSKSFESTEGPFWVCITIKIDEEGNSSYSNLILKYEGKAILILPDHDDIEAYLLTNVKLNIEIIKSENEEGS